MDGESRIPGMIAGIAGAAAAVSLALVLDLPRWLVIGLVVLIAIAGMWGVMVVADRQRAARAAIRQSVLSLRDRAALGSPSDRREDEAALLDQTAGQLVAQQGAREQALASLSAVIDALDHPVMATDGEGRLVVFNRAAETWTGVTRGKAQGRPIDEVLTYAQLLKLHAAAARGENVQEHLRLPRAQGLRTVDVCARRMSLGASAGVLVVLSLRDATEESRALQVRADFVANASHELRTPIAAMRVAIDTLESVDEGDHASRQRFLAILAANVERLEEMIRDLLDLSRLESPDVTLDIGPVAASQIAATLTPTFEKACRERELSLVWDLDPELEDMRTDRKLLLLVVQNLIDNATKFAYPSTEIRVVARPANVLPEGTPRDAPIGRGLRLEVRDRGIGIPLEQQARIFERFYQVDLARTGVGASRRGTGLGLAIVKHAVRKLGGTIRVQSVWKDGTTMIVEIPQVLPGKNEGRDVA